MAYTKTTWQNDQAPAINATNLNHIETGIYDNDNKIAETIHTLGLSTATWDSTSTYDENDIVIYANKLYKNITGDYTTTNPTEDTTNWMEISIMDYITFEITNNIKNTTTSSTTNTYSCDYINSAFGDIDIECTLLGSFNNSSPTINLTTEKLTDFDFIYIECGYGYQKTSNMMPISRFVNYSDGFNILATLCNTYNSGNQWVSLKHYNDTSFKINGSVGVDTTGNVYGIKIKR